MNAKQLFVSQLVEKHYADARTLGAGRPVWDDLRSTHCQPGAGHIILAARRATGEFVGLLWLQKSGHWCDVLDLYVSPKARRQGCARLLMSRALSVASESKKCGITIEVNADNHPALQLYQNLGFLEIHRRPNYYQTDSKAADAIVMSWAVSDGKE